MPPYRKMLAAAALELLIAALSMTPVQAYDHRHGDHHQDRRSGYSDRREHHEHRAQSAIRHDRQACRPGRTPLTQPGGGTPMRRAGQDFMPQVRWKQRGVIARGCMKT